MCKTAARTKGASERGLSAGAAGDTAEALEILRPWSCVRAVILKGRISSYGLLVHGLSFLFSQFLQF